MLEKMKGRFCGLGILLAAFSASLAAAPQETVVDAAVEGIMQKNGGVGTAIAVLQDGKPLLMKGYGYADLEHKVPVKPETVFQSGSVGKMFTATAVMLLQQEGKLSLDDTLLTYFPDGPDYWGRMTIRQMLSHRGGMANIYGADSVEAFSLAKDYSDEEIVTILQGLPKSFEPDAKYEYSNSAYIMLGILVKKVSGQFYGDYLKEKLFTPIGMTTTQVNEPFEIIPNRAQGYVVDETDDHVIKAEDVSLALSQTADGSLVFTIKDLVKWDQALRGATFLPADTLEEMYAGGPYNDGSVSAINYGYGWATTHRRGHRMVGHSGYWQGFNTYLMRYVDDGFTVAVLTNSINGSAAEIAHAVAGIFNPDYKPYEPLASQDKARTANLKKLTFDYLAGKADKSRFAAGTDPLFAPVQIARLNTDIPIKAADAKFDLVDSQRQDDRLHEVYLFSSEESRSGDFIVRYTFTADGRISDMVFETD